MIKKYKGYIIIFYLLTVAALVAACFVDLRLDIALNNPESLFSRWFEMSGEMPCRLIGTVAGTLIFYIAEKSALKLLGAVINMGSSAYLGYHIASYFFKPDIKIGFGVIFGIGIGLTALYLGKFIHISEEMKKPLLILSFAGVIVMFVQLGSIEIIKMLWGRVRFRDLLKMPNYDGFTQWYHPNGYNGNRSFPSGHTAGAAMSYLMMLLPFAYEKWEKKKIICFALPLVYTSIVAYTRLVMGAHYLSDVAMGGAIGFTTVIIAVAVLDKKFFNIKKTTQQS